MLNILAGFPVEGKKYLLTTNFQIKKLQLFFEGKEITIYKY